MKEFDEEIGEYCINRDISYTRYSDDMTFSGDFNPREIITKVRKMLYKLNMKINNKKIHIINNSQQQNVTGIVVNKKIQTSSRYRNKIRQEIYYINKYGLKEHLSQINYQESQTKYLNSLYGKILYVLSIDSNNKEFIKYKELVNNLKNN